MIISLIIFCVIYGIFIGITLHFAERAGNIFTILGIIAACFMMLYCFGSARSEEWILPVTAGIVHLLFGLYFCYLLDIVTRRIDSYRKQKGYKISDRPKKKLWAVILAFLFGWCGGHKFYLGKKSQGAVYAMFFYTFIPAIIGVIEGIRFLMMPKDEFDDRYNHRCYSSRIAAPEKITPEKVIDNNAERNKSFLGSSGSDATGLQDESDSENKISELNIDNLRINIGSASVECSDKSNMKICIKGANGKIFEFKASGSKMESFQANGSPEKEYEV